MGGPDITVMFIMSHQNSGRSRLDSDVYNVPSEQWEVQTWRYSNRTTSTRKQDTWLDPLTRLKGGLTPLTSDAHFTSLLLQGGQGDITLHCKHKTCILDEWVWIKRVPSWWLLCTVLVFMHSTFCQESLYQAEEHTTQRNTKSLCFTLRA